MTIIIQRRVNGLGFRSHFNKDKEKIVIQSNKNEHPSKLSNHLQTNINHLNHELDKPDDLKIRTLILGDTDVQAAFVFIEGIVDPIATQKSVLDNLEQQKSLPEENEDLFEYVYNRYIAINDVEKTISFEEVCIALLSGSTIILVDDVSRAIIVDTVGGEERAIEEPTTEPVIRGGRSGFVENIQTNLALVRRRARTSKLRFKTYTAGTRSRTKIVLAYVDDIIDPELLKEVMRRIESINIDIIPESGYVEEWIEDSFLSPFPQMSNTERPDKLVASIMQGKFAILVEGTPFTLIAPINFANLLQSPEDYYERWAYASLLRILRYFGAFNAVFLPSLYIALISLQPGLIPTQLVLSIAGTREGVPFPPLIESLMMVITMELLQEAGARLPQTIGQTIGIVGGLVIGEAAVQAGIVSPFMVIVIAVTALSHFAIPSFGMSISFRIIRYGFIFAAGIFGLYGIVLVYIMINIHFVNLKSFGVPYSSPFAPFYSSSWSDVIVRAPLQTIRIRPQSTKPVDDTALDNQEGNHE